MSDDEDVGFGRPPKSTRFQPGESGNPGGRPRKLLSFEEEVRAELRKFTTITQGGREVRVTQQRALVHEIVRTALKGDLRAGSLLIDVLRRVKPTDPPEDSDRDDDVELLEQYVRETQNP